MIPSMVQFNLAPVAEISIIGRVRIMRSLISGTVLSFLKCVLTGMVPGHFVLKAENLAVIRLDHVTLHGTDRIQSKRAASLIL